MIGEKIHSYQINAHLGQGGMGHVYRATDTMLGREVALKMLHPQLTVEPQFLERFKKEARVLAQLLHPNIAVIYNFIEQGGNHFMVMEYVEGKTLDELMKRYGALPAGFLVPVFIQALEGLQHAHRKNVFHRDIKPANLMLTPDGTVKLMDFGIAKVQGEQKMTQVNKIVGTVEFMAPELIQGKDASAASDIYSMGVTLYELVAGKLPFESDTDFNLMQDILKKKIDPPVKFNASVPRALSDIIMKALDKKPENRFADARAFQQALLSAFPQYRDIDPATLQQINTPAAAMMATQVSLTRPHGEMLTSADMQTRVETGAAPSLIDRVKESYANNKKAWMIAAALLFLLLVGAMFMFRSGDGKDQLAQQKDSTKTQQPVDLSGGTNTVVTPAPMSPGEKLTPLDPGEPQKASPDKPKEKENKPADKVSPKETDTRKPAENPTPVEKPVQRREVSVNGKLEISLYLRDNLDGSPEHRDIPVSFTVSSPVVYDGVTIIKQGAVASGVIKLGKIQTDIDINSVTAANGQQIRLKASRGHGRRSEINSDRHYNAIVLPVKLSF